jgi:hypothetical protein
MSASSESDAQAAIYGFYLNPPVWVVNPSSPGFRADQLKKDNLASIRDEVFRCVIVAEHALSVRREGAFLFDLSGLLKTQVKPFGDDGRFESIADRIVEASRILNAFLAFFYTHDAEVDRHGRQTMVVTPESILRSSAVESEIGMSGSPTSSHLELSSYAATYTAFPVGSDTRIFGRGVVTTDAVSFAADQISNLLQQHDDVALQLCDLHLRATRAYQDHSYSLSLTLNWTICERLLGELWLRYLSENRQREQMSFINNDRLRVLTDSRSFTASVRAEVLSLSGDLPLDILNQLTATRRKRNSWLHELDGTITRRDATTAAEAAEAMLELTRNIHLKGNRSLHIRY